MSDPFPCCGGNDEHPQDHCMDCPNGQRKRKDSRGCQDTTIATCEGTNHPRSTQMRCPTDERSHPPEHRRLGSVDTQGTCSQANQVLSLLRWTTARGGAMSQR